MALERRCCPFLDLALEWRPGEPTLRLRLGGGAGVKEILRSALG